jgi:hypothetical protein
MLLRVGPRREAVVDGLGVLRVRRDPAVSFDAPGLGGRADEASDPLGGEALQGAA